MIILTVFVRIMLQIIYTKKLLASWMRPIFGQLFCFVLNINLSLYIFALDSNFKSFMQEKNNNNLV